MSLPREIWAQVVCWVPRPRRAVAPVSRLFHSLAWAADRRLSRSDGAALRYLRRWDLARCIRSLTISVTDASTARLVAELAPHLHELVLDRCAWPFVDLSTMTSLRSLVIASRRGDRAMWAPEFDALLAQSRSRIEHLTIPFDPAFLDVVVRHRRLAGPGWRLTSLRLTVTDPDNTPIPLRDWPDVTALDSVRHLEVVSSSLTQAIVAPLIRALGAHLHTLTMTLYGQHSVPASFAVAHAVWSCTLLRRLSLVAFDALRLVPFVLPRFSDRLKCVEIIEIAFYVARYQSSWPMDPVCRERARRHGSGIAIRVCGIDGQPGADCEFSPADECLSEPFREHCETLIRNGHVLGARPDPNDAGRKRARTTRAT